MRRNTNIHKLPMCFIFLIFFVACHRDNNHPGYVYLPDMDVSRAYDTYSENPNFEDGKTLREPVDGTVPRGYEPFNYEKTVEDKERAGRELENPVPLTENTIEEGKILYNVFCINCHGFRGDGQGNLITSKRYPYPPAALITERVQNLPDGEIFHVITKGYGVMGAHAGQINREDRWKIAHYIKHELKNAKIEKFAGEELQPISVAAGEDVDPMSNKGIGPVANVDLGAIDMNMVSEGKELFEQFCTSCHKPDKRYIGPAPAGILDRRTPEWIMNMILDPEKMVKNDPIARKQLAEYISPMANQNLTQEQARKILEYFRTLTLQE